MTRVNNKYTSDFKIQVVKKYLEGGFSIQEICDEFGIKSKTQVHNWVKKYESKGEEVFKFETRGNPKEKRLTTEELFFQDKDEELKFLRMENAYLKGLCAMLKTSLKKRV